MSGYLESLVLGLGLTETAVVQGKPTGWAVAAVPVETLLGEDQNVVLNPIVDAETPHPCDPAHVLVDGDKASKGRRDRISRAAPLVHIVP